MVDSTEIPTVNTLKLLLKISCMIVALCVVTLSLLLSFLSACNLIPSLLRSNKLNNGFNKTNGNVKCNRTPATLNKTWALFISTVACLVALWDPTASSICLNKTGTNSQTFPVRWTSTKSSLISSLTVLPEPNLSNPKRALINKSSSKTLTCTTLIWN